VTIAVEQRRKTSIVTPAQAGIQGNRTSPALDARFRGHDEPKYDALSGSLP